MQAEKNIAIRTWLKWKWYIKPEVTQAEFINEVLKPSEEQQDMVAAFSERAESVRAGMVYPTEDNMLKITNDGRKCVLDQRLLNELLPDRKSVV